MENFLHVQNFKCFTDVCIPLRNLTVLAGGNSAGKSTVIQSLLLLRSAIQNKKEGRQTVNLNGEYLLGLGNSFDILSKNASSSLVSIGLNYGRQSFREVILEPNIKEAEVYLYIQDLKAPDPLKNLLEKYPLLQNLHYLNAERLGPRPYYSIAANDKNVGWQGEYTISLLSSSKAETRFYDVHEDKMYPGSTNPRLRAQAEAWMGEIVPDLSINPQKISEINQAYIKYGDASPQNVGFGISYVLPIVVSGLIAGSDEMLIVENPEAHLHPSGQSRIGRFLARVADSGTQVIVETHSEHVINGIRIASLDGTINHKDVLINFFSKERDSIQSVIKSIDINEAGDLMSYPRGFFDQQQRDFAEIVEQKRNRHNKP